MRGADLLNKLENIDPAYIEAAAVAPNVKKSNWIKKFAVIAACLVLVISGSYAYAAEVKEYNDAIQFFNNYDLSTENLTRVEIKKVYRDITTKSFTYSKTAEIILNSLSTDRVDGWEIFQEASSPQEIEELWNYKYYNGYSAYFAQDGVHYTYRSEYGLDEYGISNYKDFKGSYFEKYVNDTLVWSAFVPEFEILGYDVVSDGYIVYGTAPSFNEYYPWITKIDKNGNILWKQQISDEFHHESVNKVIENADGSYAVMSRKDFDYFCLTQYTKDGKKILYKATEIGNYGIWNAARLGDGYVVQIGSYIPSEHANIIKVDRKGNVTNFFTYASDDCEYYITDMIEFNGSLYLSAYVVPKFYDEKFQNVVGVGELTRMLSYVFDNYRTEDGFKEVPTEALTSLARESYNAILLKCDPKTGALKEFYSVKGSLGGKLYLNESGGLLWDVESFISVKFSPVSNSYTFFGTCEVFRYAFDRSGELIGQIKTDEITEYRR